MITLSMTYKEMYDNLAEDKQKVDIFVERQLPRAIKAFKTEKKFPNCKCYEYTIPATNNHYIIYFYVEISNRVNNPIVGSFFYIFDGTKRFVLRWGASPYKHTENSELILLRQLHVYTYHFFQRYNERFLRKENLSANEIVSIFLARNQIPTPIEVNEKINRNVSNHGGNNYAFKIRDGFCFAKINMQGEFDCDGIREKDKVHAVCFVYTTFLSSSEINNLQNDEIEKQNKEAWNMFREDIPLGGITLTLEQ